MKPSKSLLCSVKSLHARMCVCGCVCMFVNGRQTEIICVGKCRWYSPFMLGMPPNVFIAVLCCLWWQLILNQLSFPYLRIYPFSSLVVVPSHCAEG